MVQIEIELLNEINNDQIYDLRNFLKQHIPQADISLKNSPPAPGQMGFDFSIINVLVEAITAVTLEQVFHQYIFPSLKLWFSTTKTLGADNHIKAITTLRNGDEKTHIMQDDAGNIEVYNYKYAINTDKTKVLLIGVGEFDSGFHPIPPIKGNIEGLYKLLTDKTRIGIPRENIAVLQNETNNKIQKQLLQISRAENTETLIIYFAGHGYKTDVKKLSLIAKDTEKIGDEIIGGIDFDFISNKVLKGSTAKQKILILDTCHSGIATQGTDDVTMGFDVKGSFILTSSPGDEVSYFDTNAQNTYFTGALIDVLNKGIDNTNEMLALEDIYEYATSKMSEKDFPSPNAKSELNIPASNFFIARNPSFSSDKLKWKAYKLFSDGKLQEALDELRALRRRYPDDEQVRKRFEECETEFSFSKLFSEANTFFYQHKNFAKAEELYRKAYDLKKDSTVMEMINQCGLHPHPITAHHEELEKNIYYKQYNEALKRKAYYAASLSLKKTQQSLPDNIHVNEQLNSLNDKLKNIADVRKDDRLTDYFQQLDSKNFNAALAALKMQRHNDPEYPVFEQLEKDLLKLIPTKPFPKKAIVIVTSIIALLSIILLIKHSGKNYSALELKEMLNSSDSSTAISLLQKQVEKNNDSAKLVLGNYYKQAGNYETADSLFENTNLAEAKSAQGEMHFQNQSYFSGDSSLGEKYFRQALALGSDTTAYYYLGLISLNSYNLIPFNFTLDSVIKYFSGGYYRNSTRCKDSLSSIYFARGDREFYNGQYDDAYGSLLLSASYGNANAMMDMGSLFADTSWSFYNNNSAEKWQAYATAIKNNNLDSADYAYTLNTIAVAYMSKPNSAGTPNYDTACDVLWAAKIYNPGLEYVYYNLGLILEYGGSRIKINKANAIGYYEFAAGKKYQKAITALKRLGVAGY